MKTHLRPTATAICLVALTLMLGGCGTKEGPTSAVAPGTPGAVDGSAPDETADVQEWLDSVDGAASIRTDTSASYPHELLSSQNPSGSSRDSNLFSGQIAGPARIELFDDSPFEHKGVTLTEGSDARYAFIVVPVSVGADGVGDVKEVWFELGLVNDPESQLEPLVDSAPSPGTRLVVVGHLDGNSMVLPGGYGAMFETADGRAAVRLNSQDSSTRSFNELDSLARKAIS